MITAETAELVESPCSLIVGTVDATGLPDASRAWGAEVIDDGHVRVLLSIQAEVTRRNVERGGRVAVTATHFFTFESVQLKGVAIRIEEATPADRIRFDHYCSGAAAAIAESDGTPLERVMRFVTAGIYACTMTVEAVFDQTPGRSAGAQLAPS
ncbi:MAG TPA: pyridoxamine 5'-phosphate oxidase family protein [Acidimicrobiia bacterium]|nr:pyridoxamine 5'-phosphate oxidase family protein [Acidimicrobiia bacterium]